MAHDRDLHSPDPAALRTKMAQSALDGLIIPRWDAHQSEYCFAADETLAWATGFDPLILNPLVHAQTGATIAHLIAMAGQYWWFARHER